jgi:hypothetical protein
MSKNKSITDVIFKRADLSERMFVEMSIALPSLQDMLFDDCNISKYNKNGDKPIGGDMTTNSMLKTSFNNLEVMNKKKKDFKEFYVKLSFQGISSKHYFCAGGESNTMIKLGPEAAMKQEVMNDSITLVLHIICQSIKSLEWKVNSYDFT